MCFLDDFRKRQFIKIPISRFFKIQEYPKPPSHMHPDIGGIDLPESIFWTAMATWAPGEQLSSKLL